MRASKRRCCSSWPTSSQNLMQDDARVDDVALEPGQVSRNALYWSFVQKPITYSTPARLYQLRSKMTTSPAAGKCWM